MVNGKAKSVLIFYHFLPPDEVVSSVHFGQLAAGLSERGWRVTAFTSNRMRHDARAALPKDEVLKDVQIRRVWRPSLSQATASGRLVNGVVLILNWMLHLLFEIPRNRPEVVVFGTDPIMSIVLAPLVKFLSPKTRVVQWCFDLYPEALEADGILVQGAWLYRMMRMIANYSYQKTDAIVDIGRCMRKRVYDVAQQLKFVTVYPWAMKELESIPDVDPALRKSIYGDAKLACHYSGNLGHAHEFSLFLRLAMKFSNDDIVMRFSVRGSRKNELKEALKHMPDNKVILDDLVPESQLKDHLRTADIHLVSLRENWTGIVVPSKFFGSMAVGRPVLYSGPMDSEIARIIDEEKVGWVLREDSLDQTFMEICATMSDPQQMQSLRSRCFELYNKNYSHQAGIERFDQLLSSIIS
jgi:colanic acid biosynthesis glycosyl transferase WcaI